MFTNMVYFKNNKIIIFVYYLLFILTNGNYFMNDASLVRYISHLLDAYGIMSKRVDALEDEVRLLKERDNPIPNKECKIYDMREVHKLKLLRK